MWEKRRLLIYFRDYPFQDGLTEAQSRDMVANGVVALDFIRYLSKKTTHKNDLERLKRERFITETLHDLIQEGYLEDLSEKPSRIILLRLTTNGRRLLKFGYCLNKSINEYGEIKTIIMAVLIALIGSSAVWWGIIQYFAKN